MCDSAPPGETGTSAEGRSSWNGNYSCRRSSSLCLPGCLINTCLKCVKYTHTRHTYIIKPPPSFGIATQAHCTTWCAWTYWKLMSIPLEQRTPKTKLYYSGRNIALSWSQNTHEQEPGNLQNIPPVKKSFLRTFLPSFIRLRSQICIYSGIYLIIVNIPRGIERERCAMYCYLTKLLLTMSNLPNYKKYAAKYFMYISESSFFSMSEVKLDEWTWMIWNAF